MEAGSRHHDLGHPSLASSLYHLVQVPGELLVGQVCPDVHNDVVGEFVHHGGGGHLLLDDIVLVQLALPTQSAASHS